MNLACSKLFCPCCWHEFLEERCAELLAVLVSVKFVHVWKLGRSDWLKSTSLLVFGLRSWSDSPCCALARLGLAQGYELPGGWASNSLGSKKAADPAVSSATWIPAVSASWRRSGWPGHKFLSGSDQCCGFSAQPGLGCWEMCVSSSPPALPPALPQEL